MSAYASDPRVTARGDGYDVRLRLDSLNGWVRPAVGGGWTAKLEGVGALPQTFPTADDAIHSLLGEPR